MTISDDFFELKSNDSFMQLIESLPIGILLFNSMGKITFINNNFLEICAYHNIEIHPSNKINIFTEDLFPGNQLINYFQRLREGFTFEKEIEAVKKFAHRQVIVFLKAVPLFRKNQFDGGILILQDVKFNKEKPLLPESIDNQWKDLIDAAVDLLLITDENGNLKFSFGKKAKKFTWRISPFEQNNIYSLFPEETNSILKERLEEVKLKQQSIRFSIVLLINNKPHDYQCEIEPIFDDKTNIKLIFYQFTDIRSFTQSYKQLELKFQQLLKNQLYLEHCDFPLFVVNKNGKIIYWNKNSEDTFGYPAKNSLGKNFTKLLGIHVPAYFENILSQFDRYDKVESFFTVTNADNAEEVFKSTFHLVRDKDSFIIVSCQKITEKVFLEKKLSTIENNFNSFIHESAKLIFVTDSGGTIISINPALQNFLGYSREELIHKKIQDVIIQKMPKAFSFEDLLSEYNRKKLLELSLLTKDQRKVQLSGTLHKTRNLEGKTIYIGSFEDMTALKNLENEHEIFSKFIAASKDEIAVQCDDKLIIVNDSFIKNFGYRNESEILGKSIIELAADDDIKRISEYLHLLKQNLEVPAVFEFTAKHFNGLLKYKSASVSYSEISGRSYFFFIIRDITENKKAQLALSRSEERYRNLIGHIDDFFYIFENKNDKLKLTFCTDGAIRITGYECGELTDHPKLFVRLILLEDFHIAKIKFKELIKSRLKNSSEFDFRIKNKYGNVIWVRNKIHAERDNQGKILKLYGVVSDINQIKKVEEEIKKSRDDLIKLNETKDRFLSIISHDLRTPFSSILGFTELLLNDESLTQKEKTQYVKYIQESSKSMLALVNSLLDWNRLQTGRIVFEPEKIHVKYIIEKTINSLAGAAYVKNITITSDVPDHIQVFVDENLISQVFTNLVLNAIKFTNPEGQINISVKPAESLRFLEFSVKDTGIGISAEDLKKLFSIDSKFTRDGTYGEKGSGLGLTIVKDIIQKHGGKIWAESQVGKGTTFKFTLPIASSIILLVDDNKTDRLLYSKILKHIAPDYEIEVSSNGKEAIEKIIKSTPALVITDHDMPVMNGIQLVQEIQKLDAKIKPSVLVLSGEIDKSTILDYNVLGVDFIFQKPVNIVDFKKAVEKMIRKGLLGT